MLAVGANADSIESVKPNANAPQKLFAFFRRNEAHEIICFGVLFFFFFFFQLFFYCHSFIFGRVGSRVSVYTRATERLKINGLWGQRRFQNSSIRPFVRPSVNKQCWEVFGVNQVAKKFLSTWVLLFTEKEISRMFRNTYTHTSLFFSSCVQCLTYYSTRCTHTHTQVTCVYIVQSQLYTNTCSSWS